MDYQSIFDQLRADKQLRDLIDLSMPIPENFCLSTDIRLIVLGQDPTVKNPKSRKQIRTVLNLDVPHGSLRRYLEQICKILQIGLDQNVLATNLVRNFFKDPPARWDRSILHRAATIWKPQLLSELNKAPKAPIISLGQPLLEVIAISPASNMVREYWGYRKGASRGRKDQFKYLKTSQNILQRTVFPMPHQPSISKQFYANTISEYVYFIGEISQLTV